MFPNRTILLKSSGLSEKKIPETGKHGTNSKGIGSYAFVCQVWFRLFMDEKRLKSIFFRYVVDQWTPPLPD